MAIFAMNASDVSMKPDLTKALVMAALLFMPLSLSARPTGEGDVYWGTIHSPKGFGVFADFLWTGRGFNSFGFYADIYGISSLKASVPGIRFSFLHNVVLKQGSLGEGDATYSLFAGPGLMAGYVMDRDVRQGFAAGVSGDAGVRFDFPSSFAVCIFLQADLALHMKMHSQTTLSLYQNGLYQAWMPVLSISYRFK
ncbi:MAG: hypothetical protein IKI70_00010 [Bacteroidales bacterium]|nr:hypothetical protein [Bacteroidales bacterium]